MADIFQDSYQPIYYTMWNYKANKVAVLVDQNSYIIIYYEMRKSLLLLIFAIIIILSNQQCSQTTENDLLQSGSTFFYNANSGPNTRQHLYQFPISFTAPSGNLQVVASSSNFQISSNIGVNFQIMGSAGSTSAFGAVLLLIGEDSSWTTIRVFYLVSSRSDFFLGTFSAGTTQNSLDIYLQQKFSGENSISTSYVLPGWASPQQTFTAVALLSGVRTTASNYAVSIGGASFDSLSGLFVVQLDLNSSIPIESLTISYVIFGQSTPFTFTNFNLLTGSSATYQLIGISQLNNGKSIYSGYGFNSQAVTQNFINCIGGNCPAQCIASLDCQRSNGIISQGVCLLCLQGQIPTNGVCQVRPSCGLNQYYNGTGCACYMGYLLINAVCYPGCGTNAYIFNSQCICIPGYAYSSVTNTCVQKGVPTCGPNYVLTNNKCVCKRGFGLINNLCVACPANSRIIDGNCICDKGFTLSTPTLSCVPDCFPNSYRNIFGQCVCNNGYYSLGNSCVAASSCINGQVWNGSGCSCPQGQITDSITKQCTYCNTPDRMASDGSCVCSPSFYPTEIGCSQCTNNSVYNSALKSCQCATGYQMQNGLCAFTVKCPHQSVWNPSTLRCDCNYFGQYVINGFCQPCQLNSNWNGTACACNPGFVANGPLCSCPINSSWNGRICACNRGFISIGDTCSKCDINSVFVSPLQPCVCKAGWFGIYNKCSQCHANCTTCSGPGVADCLTCPSSTKISNGQCIPTSCPSGQYVDSNSNCQPCINYCSVCSNGTSCSTCQSGYNLSLSVSGSNIVSTCQLIPTGTSSTLTLRGQVVGNGLVFQGVALSLMPTAILSTGCSICNNLLSVSIVNSFATITTDVQYVTNSQYWFVVTFNFGNAPFIPSFDFTIQLNPDHASYFSVQDMAQRVTGSGGATVIKALTRNSLTTKQIGGSSNQNSKNQQNTISISASASASASASPGNVSPSAKDPKTLSQLFG